MQGVNGRCWYVRGEIADGMGGERDLENLTLQ